MINKLAIQPQIEHNQATKTCEDHIKAFTHERAYMRHFSKNIAINHGYKSRSSRAKPN
jgi:cell fate (sporulation/competence/biofilm development) regulator YmcA (YheA/YmcA/DUF963 family)